MSGPVWRWEKDRQGMCHLCLNQVTGLFVEGEVVEGELVTGRMVCRDCYTQFRDFLLGGERGGKAAAPAYAHR